MKIIFVCWGNSCRSPMAKYIMRDMLEKSRLADKVTIDSAGCGARVGSRLSRGAREMLQKFAIPFDKHSSKPFTLADYENFDCVIALDLDILNEAKDIADGDPDKKIRMFKNFNGVEINVDDPMGTGNYARAFSQISLGCKVLLKEIADKFK